MFIFCKYISKIYIYVICIHIYINIYIFYPTSKNNLNIIRLSRFLVRVSYLEIYNEECRDLLGKDQNTRLDVKGV